MDGKQTVNAIEMAEEFGSGGKWIAATEALPAPRTPVLYRTAFYQAAGYVETDGEWYFVGGRAEHSPIISWREL